MSELIKVDSSFNETMFIAKVNNIFVQLHTAVMFADLNRVKHFLNTDLINKYENIISSLNNRNIIQIYDELNIKDTKIIDFTIDTEKITVNVQVISRYMEYLIDKNTKKFISGNNQSRIEKKHVLTLTKILGAQYKSVISKCPTRGNSINVNSYGQCEYCKTIFNAKDFDWILNSITTL